MSGIKMIDITSKNVVYREALAEGFIKLKKETIERILRGKIEKGDILSTTQIAGIMAAKKTWELLPLCHPLPLTSISIDVNIEEEGIRVVSTVKTTAKTGVEMEALTSVSIALLNIWDMVKAYEKDERGQYPSTYIKYIKVLRKKKEEI